MEEAERIAREEHGSGRIAVISGESLLIRDEQGVILTVQVWGRGTIIVGWGIGWMGLTW